MHMLRQVLVPLTSVIRYSSALACETSRASQSVQVQGVDVALARQHIASVKIHALPMYLLQEAAEVHVSD